MPFVKPTLTQVIAGQPVTANGWNAVLDAVGALYDGVNSLGTESLTVNLRSDGRPVLNAVIVAVPTTGIPVVAIPPHGTQTCYILTELVVGSYTLHVAAAGF